MPNPKWILPLMMGAAVAVLLAQSSTPIDNDQVHVVAVTDQPHKKSQPHDHKLNRVMVYLEAGKQEIVQDGIRRILKFRAGDVKWSPATGTHTSEIVSEKPVTIVEVELKKPGDPNKQVTTKLDPLKVAPKEYHLIFENDQVRVTRVKFPPLGKAALHEHQLNRIVVILTDQNTRMTGDDGKSDTVTHKPGDFYWGIPLKHSEENLMNKPFESIMIEPKD